MKSQVRAIRWVSFEHCDLTGPKDVRVGSLSRDEILKWEINPNREVSVEILPVEDNLTFQTQYGAIGLEVDTESTELVRIYAEDAWTLLNPDGTLRSSCIDDEEVVWGDWVSSGWENARAIYNSVENREGWAEGVVRSPRYQAVILREDDDFIEESFIKEVALTFQLPIKRIQTRGVDEEYSD